jgi:hypothetical protein
VIYSKRQLNVPTFSILRPSKIYPNRDIRFQNIPSGNPVGTNSSWHTCGSWTSCPWRRGKLSRTFQAICHGRTNLISTCGYLRWLLCTYVCTYMWRHVRWGDSPCMYSKLYAFFLRIFVRIEFLIIWVNLRMVILVLKLEIDFLCMEYNHGWYMVWTLL